jgi:energy-coupling factor transport system substrate-specific component
MLSDRQVRSCACTLVRWRAPAQVFRAYISSHDAGNWLQVVILPCVSVRTSLVIAFTALNLTIGGLVAWLKLPIYLDSMGIVLASLLLGWRAGVVCAVLTCAFGFFLVNPYLPFFTGTAIVIALVVDQLRRRNMYRTTVLTFVSALILACAAALTSAPVAAFVFGGVTTSGSDLLTAFFRTTGRNLLDSVMLSQFTSEPVDKTIVTFVAISVVRALPRSFLAQHQLRAYRD